MLCACFTACTLQDMSTTGNGAVAANSAIQLNQKGNPIAPTKYQNKEFTNVDELVEWIQTEDVENFQEGRYKNGISLLRSNNKILIPSFSDPNMPSPRIEVMPDNFYPDGHTVIGYFYYLPEKTVVIFVKGMNKTYAVQAEEGVSDYLAAQYDAKYAQKPVLETIVDTKELKINSFNAEGRSSAKKIEEVIPYVKSVDSETSSEEIAQAFFLYDGFEVKLMQPNKKWDDLYLGDLCLEAVTLGN